MTRRAGMSRTVPQPALYRGRVAHSPTVRAALTDTTGPGCLLPVRFLYRAHEHHWNLPLDALLISPIQRGDLQQPCPQFCSLFGSGYLCCCTQVCAMDLDGHLRVAAHIEVPTWVAGFPRI